MERLEVTQTRPVGRLIRRSQDADPQVIVDTLLETVQELGGSGVVLYLVDYDLKILHPFTPSDSDEVLEAVSIDSSVVGRCFSEGEIVLTPSEGGTQAWIPVMERNERTGCLGIHFEQWEEDLFDVCEELGAATAHLTASASHYTDRMLRGRRRNDMSLAAEMQWNLLPPLTFNIGGTVIAGLLEPAYQVGGDCFDYSLNGAQLDFAIFDSMGHGVSSAMLASLAVAAYRNARRSSEPRDLQDLVRDMDAHLFEHTHGDGFVTAVFGRLDLETGSLDWASAGHPHPIHVRDRALIEHRDLETMPPLGLGRLSNSDRPFTRQVNLQPGDSVLLYTDGVVDARNADGGDLGQDRLAQQLVREQMSGRPSAEVLRRVVRNLLALDDTHLRDDASMLYVRWAGDPILLP